jgi:hypothetical protein
MFGTGAFSASGALEDRYPAAAVRERPVPLGAKERLNA